MFNRSTQIAISAMGCLAEAYDDPPRFLSAAEIAEMRRLQKPYVAKVMTALSHAKLIKGSPGPGGGYQLNRPPIEITLKEIASLFEREDDIACPYGPDYCGREDKCPLHDHLVHLRKQMDDFLEQTTLEGFRVAHLKRQQKAKKNEKKTEEQYNYTI